VAQRFTAAIDALNFNAALAAEGPPPAANALTFHGQTP